MKPDDLGVTNNVMPKPNNYFVVSTPFGHRHLPFDDLSETCTRTAFAEARMISDDFKNVAGFEENITVYRPLVWRIERDMGIVGRIASIRHAPDPTVTGSMRIYCRLCGVSAVIRGENAAHRDRTTDTFEVVHAPHWLEELERKAQAARVALAKHQKKVSSAA